MTQTHTFPMRTFAISATLIYGTIAYAQNPLEKAPVVAKQQTVGTDKVAVCDFASLKDNTLTLPLSLFAEEMQIVKLDDKDEALVVRTGATIIENYILVP